MPLNQHIRSYLQNHQLMFDGRSDHANPHQPAPSNTRPLHSPSGDSPRPEYLQCSDFFKRQEQRKPALSERPPRKPPAAKASLSSRFPFSQCTDPQLRETKNSINSSVELAVKSYTMPGRRGERQLLYDQKRPATESTETITATTMARTTEAPASATSRAPTGVSGPESDSDGHDSASELTLVNSASSSIPSSIMKKPADLTGKSTLVKAVYVGFHRFYEETARLPPAALHDELMVHTLNYITNYFLQSFSSSNTRQLCGEILQGLRADPMQDTLVELVEELEYRHEVQGLEEFKDLCVQKLDGSETGNVCDPQLYGVFRRTWRLNPTSFLDHNLDILFTACEKEWSDYTRWQAQWPGVFDEDFEDSGMKMNLLRFYYLYRWEVQEKRDRPQFSDSQLERLTVLLCEAVERVAVTLGEEKSPESGVKKKSLRFHEDVS